MMNASTLKVRLNMLKSILTGRVELKKSTDHCRITIGSPVCLSISPVAINNLCTRYSLL